MSVEIVKGKHLMILEFNLAQCSRMVCACGEPDCVVFELAEGPNGLVSSTGLCINCLKERDNYDNNILDMLLDKDENLFEEGAGSIAITK